MYAARRSGGQDSTHISTCESDESITVRRQSVSATCFDLFQFYCNLKPVLCCLAANNFVAKCTCRVVTNSKAKKITEFFFQKQDFSVFLFYY